MRSVLVIGAALILGAVACGDGGTTVENPGGNAGGFPDVGGSGGSFDECDVDGDDHEALSCGGDDCDDTSADTHPGAAEACDAVDTDCDGVAAEACDCEPGDVEACSGDPTRAGVGACRAGTRTCGSGGVWSECAGEVAAVSEVECNGVDDDCNGTVDDGMSCNACLPGAVEICSNGLDDDCNGEIDDAAVCTLDCSTVDPRSPTAGGLSCCGGSPVPLTTYKCTEGQGLEPCTSGGRACVDVDGDPATQCVRGCDATGCYCGTPGEGLPTQTAGCGFLTPCARMDCDGRQHQPCYGGPPSTLGVGICHGGFHSCEEDRTWGACEGQQLPVGEICGNGLDDDCDGSMDESDASGAPCPVGNSCPDGATEVCGNGLDDDCDGFADEGCAAPAGASQACWTGSALRRGVGACTDGSQSEQDGRFGLCTGQVLPAAERCGDGVDSDCNGLGGTGQEEDPACCVPGVEVCNGEDDDCDGLIDEGKLTHCGTCEGPCFDLQIDDLAECSGAGRTCDQIAPFWLDASAITLGAPRPATPDGVMHVAEQSYNGQQQRYGDLRVHDIQTSTGTLLRTHVVGDNPSMRSIATGPDGSYWLAYSRFNFPAEPAYIEHRSRNGDLLCKEIGADIASFVVDTSGEAWAVRNGEEGEPFPFWLRKYSGSKVGPPQDGVPTCLKIDLAPTDSGLWDVGLETGGPIALDANGILWIPNSDGGSGGNPILRIDTLRPSQVGSLEVAGATTPGFAMIGPDEALYIGPSGPGGSGGYARVDVSAGWAGDPIFAVNHASPSVRGIDVGSDGAVWGALANSQGGFGQPPREAFLAQLDPTTNTSFFELGTSDTASCNDVLIDEGGYPWVAVDDTLYRWDAKSLAFTLTVPLGDRLWLHPGSTARLVKDLQRRRGRWTQEIDPGVYNVRWSQLAWEATVPVGTRVLAYARFADKVEDLEGTQFVCGPFEASPADLAGCSGGRRHARVEFVLSGAGAPAVSTFEITWDRP